MHISTHLQATLNPSRAQHMTTLMQTKGREITQNSNSIELLLITPAAIAKAWSIYPIFDDHKKALPEGRAFIFIYKRRKL